jgi:GT2 family glycosyltransferase
MNKFYITSSIVLFNTQSDQLERLLECINDSKLIDHVYLIDNSTNSLNDYTALTKYSPVNYLKMESNLGYGAGHNIALRLAIQDGADFHFVFNPDIYFQPDALHKMIGRIREDTSIGQLMPKVVYQDGGLQYLCKLIPSPFDLFFRRFLRGPLKGIARKQAEHFELRFTDYKHEMDVPYLSGCFMLFRVSALKEIGLFDERFFMYPEDIDITRRMHAKYRTIFFPSALIVHDHAKESYKSFKMLWIHITNIIKYFNKWGWFFDAERKIVNSKVIETLRKQGL